MDKRGSRREPRVVLCGSMSAWAQMHDIAGWLIDRDVDAVVPRPDEPQRSWSVESSNAAKRAASLSHMDAIRDADTAAILVVNVDRSGRRDYIGPNTFAEIAVAVADRKSVYLLQGMPDAYADELLAWGAVPLFGDLEALVTDVHASSNIRVRA